MLEVATFIPPSQSELEDEAGRQLQRMNPTEYRELKRTDKLSEYRSDRATEVCRHAMTLIGEGQDAVTAWNTAKRWVIYETEAD